MNERNPWKMSKHRSGIFLFLIFFASTSLKAQQDDDSALQQATIDECVQYALTHQPAIKQSQIDQQIVEADIKTRLADWYPQLNFDYSIQHYFKTPKFSSTGVTVQNFSTGYFSLNQTIFNPDVLLASKTSGDVRTAAKQLTENDKIYVVLNVSKAFYNVLLTQQQIDLVNQDIARLDRSVKNAF